MGKYGSWDEQFERVVEGIEDMWTDGRRRFTNTDVWNRIYKPGYGRVCEATRMMELDGALVRTNPGGLPKVYALAGLET